MGGRGVKLLHSFSCETATFSVMAGLDPATQGLHRIHNWPSLILSCGMEKRAFVYFMASKRSGTLYVGVTDCLAARVWQHRSGLIPGFTKRYGVRMLVYYESFETITAAIRREQNIKHWPRRWKLELIEKLNPQWCDLYENINS